MGSFFAKALSYIPARIVAGRADKLDGRHRLFPDFNYHQDAIELISQLNTWHAFIMVLKLRGFYLCHWNTTNKASGLVRMFHAPELHIRL